MKGMHYRNYEMTLEKGGMLFLYTDGAPEATNAQEELFGVPRLLDTLNACSSERPVPLLHSVKESISAFVGSAEQFDDLTMLAVTLL